MDSSARALQAVGNVFKQAVSSAQAGLQEVGKSVAAVAVEPLKSVVSGGSGRGSAQRSERELGACARGRVPSPPNCSRASLSAAVSIPPTRTHTLPHPPAQRTASGS